MGTLVAIGAIAGPALGLVSVIWHGVNFYQQRKNAPDMVTNKLAEADQHVTDKTNADLKKNDAAAVEQDLS